VSTLANQPIIREKPASDRGIFGILEMTRQPLSFVDRVRPLEQEDRRRAVSGAMQRNNLHKEKR